MDLYSAKVSEENEGAVRLIILHLLGFI